MSRTGKIQINFFQAIILLCFMPSLSFGQEIWWPLYPEGIPCESNLEMEIVEKDIGKVVSKVREPKVLVYPADPAKASGAAVVICPGGGYTILAWDWEGTKMAEWFQDMGVSAFVLQYRLPHWENEECRSKVALMDAQRAFRLVRLNANEFKINKDRIGVMGFSAGGHLASTVSTHFDEGQAEASMPIERESCRPDFSILMYPVVTMDTSVAHSGSRKNLIGPSPTREMETYFSNEKQITNDTPPTLLIHANDDQGVIPENSIHYYLGLRKHGVPAALHIYESGGHGFSFAEDMGSVSGWPQVCQRWMDGLGLLSK